MPKFKVVNPDAPEEIDFYHSTSNFILIARFGVKFPKKDKY